MITSTSNVQVKEWKRLASQQKARREAGLFVVEGLRGFLEIPPDSLEQVVVSESFFKQQALIVEKHLNGSDVKITPVSDAVFRSVSDTQSPQGVLAIVRQIKKSLADIINKDTGTGAPPLMLVLENIQDPGNLGTIVRTAEGAGVTAIIMSGNTADIYNPKVVRSTMGSLFRVPFTYVTDIGDTLRLLKGRGIRLYAAALPGAFRYDKADYRGPCAVMVGNEGNGLTDETASMADASITIPMCGQLESLNAAVASSILIYEARRQRLE